MIGKSIVSVKLLSSSVLNHYLIWIIGLLACGFPLIAFTTVSLGIVSTPFSIAYRFIMLTMCLFLFLVLLAKGLKRLNYGIFFLLCFWAIYSIRLIWDISIDPIEFPKEYTPFYLYSFAFGNCLIPFIIIGVFGREVDISKLIFFIFILLALQNILLFKYLIQENGFSIKVLAERQALGFKNKAVLNPISLSRAGGFLVILCLCYLSIIKSSFKLKLITVPILLISIYILLSGSSRGPLLFTILSIFLIFCFKFYIGSWIGRIRIIISIVLFGILFSAIAVKYNINSKKIGALSRLEKTVNRKTKDDREKVWALAKEQIRDNPILGDQFLTKRVNFYPHNILLEVPMATGVVGSLFFALGLIFMMYKFIKVFFEKKPYMFSLGVFTIFNTLSYFTSGSLYEGVDLWVLLAAFFSMKEKV